MSAVLEALLVGPSVADLKREVLERDIEIKDLREQVRAYQEADQRDFLNDNSDQLALIIQTKNQVIQSLQSQLEQQGLGTEYAKALDGEASSVAALTKLQDQLHELREQLSEHREGEAKAKKELAAIKQRLEAGRAHGTAADGPGNGKATAPPKASAMAAEAGPSMPCHIGTQVAVPATAPAQEPMADASAPPEAPAEAVAPAMPPPPPPPPPPAGPPPAVAEAARLREEVASLRSQLDAQQQTLAAVQSQRDQVANEVQTVLEAKRNDASEMAQMQEELQKLRPALEQKDAEFLRISAERDQARELADELHSKMVCLVAREEAVAAQPVAQSSPEVIAQAVNEARKVDTIEIARLLEELQRQRLALDQKDAELRPALEKEAELLRKISERDQELERQRLLLEQKEAEVRPALEKEAELLRTISERDQELERLRPALEQKEAELLRACTERDQAREGGAAEIARVQEELERLRPALEQKEAELLRASSERDQDRRLAEELHSQIEAQAAELANAVAGRDEAVAAASSAASSAASAVAAAAQAEDAASRSRQLDEREGMLAEREQALTAREQTLVTREQSSAGALAQLTTLLDEATGEADTLKAEKRSLELELAGLRRPAQADSDPENRHLADLRETLGTQVDEWDWGTVVSEVKSLAAAEQSARSRVVELDQELHAARLAAEAAKQAKTASEGEAAALRDQLQSLPARGPAAPPPEPSLDAQEAERRAQAAEKKLAAAEQKVETVTNTVANLSASLEEALQENETVKAELDALKAAKAAEGTSPAAPAAPASSADGPGSGALIPAASKRSDDAQRLQAALQAAETARREAQEAKQACHEATVRAQRLEGQLSRARLGDESVEQEVAKLTGRATTASAFLGSGGIAGLIAASLQDVEMGTSTGVTLNDLGVGDFNALQQVDRYLQVLSALMAVRADARLSVFGLWVLCHSIYVLYLLHAHFLG